MNAQQRQQLEVLGQAICRSPLFPMETTLIEAWPILKRLIKDSAPEFYSIIAELDADDLSRQPEKVCFTIWKYFNRSRYRATPFGEFAAVAMIPVQTGDGSIVLQQDIQVLSRPDWKSLQQIDYQSPSLLKANFRTNPLCYLYGQEFHYLFRGEKQFELNAIERREDLELLLNFCRTLRSFEEIGELMWEELAMKKRGLLSLLKELLELQVLECDLQANITGQDFFERTRQETTDLRYTIATRCHIDGGLKKSITHELKAYTSFISQCIQPASNDLLDEFKQNFLQLWEQRSVPLSLALDPILGIGYGQDKEGTQLGLVGELQHRPGKGQNHRIVYNRLEQFLLSKMVEGGEIQLADFKLEYSHTPLPNTTNVLFHLYQGHPVIHHAGAATATALLGRFTPVGGINELCLQLTEIEQGANPDVIFFDIAYQFEGRTDNVNRRQHLFATELPIGSWSTFPHPLNLQDIMVSIKEGQIILNHTAMGARLVPRLASAYNHGRSDLGLFRFLCDLQYQGIQSQLSIDLPTMFPNLDYYPRVYFDKIIASPAKWKLHRCENVETLLSWLAERNLTQPFTIGKGDQTLVIDPKVSVDLNNLLQYQKLQTSDVYLTEALIDQAQMVCNENGKGFHAQFILALTHQNKIYKPYNEERSATQHRDLRMPGGEWLYMELYLHPEIMDEFLTGEIRTLIKQQQELIKEWFFIRYNQPEPHLRLRLNLKNPSLLPTLLVHISGLMDISKHYGPLKRMEIRSYEREIFRYGEQQLDKVEHFFYLDSLWALEQLRLSLEDRYAQIITFAQKLCAILFQEISDQTAFFGSVAENFAKEMSFTKHDFKKINQAYRQQHMSERTNEKLVRYFGKLITNYQAEKREILLADLIHMHVNRRFNGAPRVHEAVLYQFLYKRSLAQQQQQKNS